jgi:hypothetical protein
MSPELEQLIIKLNTPCPKYDPARCFPFIGKEARKTGCCPIWATFGKACDDE